MPNEADILDCRKKCFWHWNTRLPQAIFWRDYKFIKFVCVDLKSNDMDVQKCRITGGEKWRVRY